jgi:serine/threonine protein phosphatase PrpC
VKSLVAALREAGDSDEPSARPAILNGIEAANRVIRDLGVGAATTIAAVEIRGGMIRPYHVGDSLILVVGQKGKVKLQTVAHSPVGYGVEAGLLDETEAMHHEDRHVVSNIVGSHEMRIEVGPQLKLAPRDSVLIASDGLADNLLVEEVIERVRKGPLLDAVRLLASDALLRMSRREGSAPSKPDDLTILAFRPNPSKGRPRPESAEPGQ